MRLDWDCIRDILLCVEENTGTRKWCDFVDVSDYANAARAAIGDGPGVVPESQIPLDEKYGNEKVMYHVLYCCRDDVNLLERYAGTDTNVKVCDLTQLGHETVDLIRPTSFWRGLQKTLDDAGSGAYGTAVTDVLKAGSELLRKRILGRSKDQASDS